MRVYLQVLLLPMALTGFAHGANELFNPSFEIEAPDGGVPPAGWTSVGDYLSQSDAVAHTGDWSMKIDNDEPNSFGQWKQIRPSQWEYEVDPGEELHQSLWLYVDEEEEPPAGTAVHLLTRWNGLVPQANDVGFPLFNYPLNEWFEIEVDMFVPDFDADGADVSFVTTTFYVNTNNDPDDLGGALYYDDAFWGRLGDEVLPGDYNNDGLINAADADEQAIAMKTPDQNLATFDENNDGVIDFSDRQIWVKQHAKTWVGDANLDGEFNSTDFVDVFTAGKYETGAMAGWAEGDWDGSMFFDSSDFVTAFADGGYEMGPLPAAAVPEPASLFLAMTGLGAAWLTHRRRRTFVQNILR